MRKLGLWEVQNSQVNQLIAELGPSSLGFILHQTLDTPLMAQKQLLQAPSPQPAFLQAPCNTCLREVLLGSSALTLSTSGPDKPLLWVMSWYCGMFSSVPDLYHLLPIIPLPCNNQDISRDCQVTHAARGSKIGPRWEPLSCSSHLSVLSGS